MDYVKQLKFREQDAVDNFSASAANLEAAVGRMQGYQRWVGFPGYVMIQRLSNMALQHNLRRNVVADLRRKQAWLAAKTRTR